MKKLIAKIKRYFLYRAKRKLWLKSHEPFRVLTPTLSRRCLIDMNDVVNQRRMKILRKRDTLKMRQVFKELNYEL